MLLNRHSCPEKKKSRILRPRDSFWREKSAAELALSHTGAICPLWVTVCLLPGIWERSVEDRCFLLLPAVVSVDRSKCLLLLVCSLSTTVQSKRKSRVCRPNFPLGRDNFVFFSRFSSPLWHRGFYGNLLLIAVSCFHGFYALHKHCSHTKTGLSSDKMKARYCSPIVTINLSFWKFWRILLSKRGHCFCFFKVFILALYLK